MSRSNKRIVTVYTSDKVPDNNKSSLRELIAKIANGTMNDFVLTNQHSAGKAAKLGAGVVVGSRVATEFGAVTPLRWVLSGFGPLPAEFTKCGSIHVFEFTTLQRALIVGKAALAKFVLVTIAYESGILVGSLINQTLPEATKDAIGGTINEIVNEGGWKLLFQHPFGLGM